VTDDESFWLFLDDLQEVVPESEQAKEDHGGHSQADIGVAQVSPEKCRDDRGADDQNPSHRGSPPFLQMGLGAIDTDLFADLVFLEHLDQPGAEDEDDQKGCDSG